MSDYLLFSLIGLVGAVTVWGLIVHEMTSRHIQRVVNKTCAIRMQNLRNGLGSGPLEYPDVNVVYGRHFWRAFFLMNTSDLYEVDV